MRNPWQSSWDVVFHWLLLCFICISCGGNKRLTKYKPGHIPEFENPDNEEADTYYGINSDRCFTVRRVKNSDEQLKAQDTQADTLATEATQQSDQKTA